MPERTEPRISVNKLGEYMLARPRARRRIIQDQKDPKAFKVAWYNEARVAIADYIADGGQNEQIIIDAIASLSAAEPAGDWDEVRRQVCADSMGMFLEFADELELEKLKIEHGAANPPKLSISDVDISVRPELVVTGADGQGNQIVGAIKLCFAKTNPMGEEAALYVGTMVQTYVTSHLAGQGKPARELCLVVDVFDQKIYTAPKAYKRRMSDVEAACEEIRRGW